MEGFVTVAAVSDRRRRSEIDATMRRQRTLRFQVIFILLCLAGLGASLLCPPLHGQANPPEIKLLISTEQHAITEPYPARLTLQIHNASQHTLWLYHRASAKVPPVQHVFQEGEPVETTGGSTLDVAIQPVDAKVAPAAATPVRSRRFDETRPHRYNKASCTR